MFEDAGDLAARQGYLAHKKEHSNPEPCTLAQACGDRWGSAKIMFEEAEVAMLRQRAGFHRNPKKT